MRVYGVDPQRASLRRVWVLLQRLPQGSWIQGQGPGSWTNEAYLLANVIDALNQVVWVLVATNSKRKPKQPKPVPRPGQAKQKKISWGDLGSSLTGIDGVETA